MWFNSKQREEPYLDLTSPELPLTGEALRGRKTGGAWLSSARVVRCWVKSRNERNPYPVLPASQVGDSRETAGDKPEEGGDDVKSSWPLCPGLHTCYNGRYNGLQASNRKRISKTGPSSDRRLKLASVKQELLVIADQNAAVNTFPGLVHTARHTTRVGCTRSRLLNLREGADHGVVNDWGEVVTR